MHLSFHITAIIFMGIVAGCASIGPPKAAQTDRTGLSPRNLSVGECGLFVWKADQAKTFILFADQQGAAMYKEGIEVALKSVANNIPTERVFTDPMGGKVALSLGEAQSFQDSTRYKSGRLTRLDANGWEIVTPVVGLYSCKT